MTSQEPDFNDPSFLITPPSKEVSPAETISPNAIRDKFLSLAPKREQPYPHISSNPFSGNSLYS